MVTYIALASASSVSTGQLGHAVVVPAQEGGTLSDFARSVAYMACVASGTSDSASAWHVVGTDK